MFHNAVQEVVIHMYNYSCHVSFVTSCNECECMNLSSVGG